MRQFHTAVIERKTDYTENFETQPFEAGWASEAICWLRVEDIKGEAARLDVAVQISVDGVRWVDEGTVFQTMSEPGDYFVKVSHFGGWLRLHGVIAGGSAEFNITTRLVLKE